MLVGLFLRIYHLGEESLWLDEGHSIRMAKLPVSQMVEEIAGNKHPPVYFLALHGWISIFGDSEFAVRSLSALFGVLSIFLLYQTATLLFGSRTGLLAALLLALSSFNLFYSQETRMYTLLTFLSLGSMYYYIKFLSGKEIGLFDGYLIFSTLLIYTQNFGIFIILAQNIYLMVLFIRPQSRSGVPLKRWVILQGIILLFYLPWLGILMKQILSIDSAAWRVPRPSLPGLLFSFKCFSGSFWLLGLSLPLVLYSFFPCLVGEKKGREDVSSVRIMAGHDSEMGYLPAIWLFSLVLIPFFLSQFTASIYVHRATVLATLPWYIMVARGIDRIKFKYLKSAIVMFLIIFSLVSIKEYFTQEQKDQWREVIAYISEEAKDGDLIYVYGGSPLENIFQYYYEKSILPGRKIDVMEMAFVGFNAGDVSDILCRFERVWVIFSHSRINEVVRIRKLLENDYYMAKHKRYFNYSQDQFHRHQVGLRVFLFLRKDRSLMPVSGLDKD